VINLVVGQDAKTLGWKKVTKQLQVVESAGDHHSMLSQPALVQFIEKWES
jgi:thioesterase domain-containing protein